MNVSVFFWGDRGEVASVAIRGLFRGPKTRRTGARTERRRVGGLGPARSLRLRQPNPGVPLRRTSPCRVVALHHAKAARDVPTL